MNKHKLLNLSYSTTSRLFRKKFTKNKKKIDLKNNDKKITGGLRIKRFFKKSLKGKPLITIITVTFNCKKLLEQTIKSVLNLSYDNIEFIIVDGGSSDGTLNTIKKYNNLIDFWISQKDSGIYNAMNKGSKLATGDALFFLNAGDQLINNEFISLIKLFEENENLNDKNFVYVERMFTQKHTQV